MTLPGPGEALAIASTKLVMAAIDFDSAERRRDGACAVGVPWVENGRFTDRYYRSIQPPQKRIEFTHVHGLIWPDVRASPAFGAIWPELRAFIAGAGFLVAYNASSYRDVLCRCSQAAGVASPVQEFRCTLQLVRARWNLHSASLAAVCRHLRIPQDHHHALSDAEACARIAVKAVI